MHPSSAATAPARADLGLSLRALSVLLRYPDDAVLGHLGAVRDALHGAHAVSRETLRGVDALAAHLASRAPLDVQADYVHLFDSGRSTSLHLFEHVHGDSRERGPAMIDLMRTYEAAGLLLADGELPDHLCVALEFASTQPPEQARAFVGEIAHIIQSIHQALTRRDSPYAALTLALLEIAGTGPGLAGTGEGAQAQAPDNPSHASLDADWQEPAAFDGCSNAGQHGAAQPIHFVRRTPPTGARA